MTGVQGVAPETVLPHDMSRDMSLFFPRLVIPHRNAYICCGKEATHA
jgi:hypothetical protein